MKRLYPLAVAALATVLCACQTVSPVKLNKSKAFNSEKLKAVKKVAILPFFQANAVGTDDPNYKGKYSDMMPTLLSYEGMKGGSRFEFIPLDEVMTVLNKKGFDGIQLGANEDVSIWKAITSPDKLRAGMTMQAALETGKELGATLLIGSFGMTGDAPANMRFVMAMRLVDPQTGEVIWGGAKSEPMNVSIFSPFESQKKQMRELAAKLIAEVP